MPENCANCYFWKAPAGDQGQCCFNPPVLLYATQQGIQAAEYPQTMFPVTYGNEWCGKFISIIKDV